MAMKRGEFQNDLRRNLMGLDLSSIKLTDLERRRTEMLMEGMDIKSIAKEEGVSGSSVRGTLCFVDVKVYLHLNTLGR
ncbi:hypothetical protein A2574_01535 [Candidatus Shapirobacteria bacterium RIFOXYD1_FULL_38_32]|nr:MAG: hypothetical protein A2410_03780 [Candidatus Shapirobacteria bacterium RIFOXYC1_FULL_38_24]OGL58011.1 MAG: hypothetical protein A2574_01535 [Candidatus Shapirobacteria bacterium RIFOXYD1_FULL_38_32]HCU55688.1 hypothetical protein [Candidatus Shapirobacteria bacterium]